MKARQWNLVYLASCVLLFVVLSLALDASVEPSANSGTWVQALLLVALGAFVFEPWFTGGSAATANLVGVLLVAVSATNGDFAGWWRGLTVLAGLALAASVVSFAMVNGDQPRSSIGNRRASAFAQLGAAIGRYEMAPLALLVLSLVSFNEPFGAEWSVASIVLVLVLLLARVQPAGLWSLLRGVPAPGSPLIVRELFLPSEALLVAAPGNDVRSYGVGTAICVGSSPHSAVGHLVELRPFGGGLAWRALIPDLRKALPSGGLTDAPLGDLAISIQPDGDSEDADDVADQLKNPGVGLAGAMMEGSTIDSMRIELRAGVPVSLGDVVWTMRGGHRTFWQITSATVGQTRWAGDSTRVTVADASQIGRWDDALFGFVPDIASPDAAQIAFSGEIEAPLLSPPGPNLLEIGKLPGSPFPVMIDVPALSRHHSAILGTTGTGKSHLSFALIEALCAAGSKVVIVDQTGQYSVRFPDAEVLTSVASFLDDDAPMCIYDLDGREPIGTVNTLTRGIYSWSVGQGPCHVDDAARVVVVMEEAHNYVPEGFVIDSFPLKAKAQDTSTVLMESRKYGLGFVLVSQRTAMLTKTALSQCNTLFAFQAVDRTGIDYLDALCGPHLSRSLPTLPHRVALVLGRAVVSSAPMIAYMADAEVIVP